MKISKKIIITIICAISFAAIIFTLLFATRTREKEHRKLNFSEDGLLGEVRCSPLWDEGRGEWVFYADVHQVYNDGRRVSFAENFVDGYTVDLPPVVSQLSKEEIRGIQKVIEDNEFMELPEDMSNLMVCDGGMAYITVYTMDQSHTSGGMNPMDVEGIERFDAVLAAICGEYSEAEQSYREQVDRILQEQYEKKQQEL